MRPMLASAHYATRKGLNRPFARVTARDRRIGHKLSIGLTPAQAARLEGLAAADVETLVAEPDFKALVDGYNTLHAMPEDGAAPHPDPARPPPPDGGHGPGRCAGRHVHPPPGAHGQGPGPHAGRWRDRRQQACGRTGTCPAHAQPLAARASPVRRSRPADDAAGGEPPARRAAAGACGGARRGGGG